MPLTVDKDRFLQNKANLSKIVTDINFAPMSALIVNVGPYFSYPITRNLFAGGKFDIGYGMTKASEMSIFYMDDTIEKKFEYIKSKNGNTFSFGTGVNASVMVNHNLNIKLFAEYTYLNSHTMYRNNAILSGGYDVIGSNWIKHNSVFQYVNLGVSVRVMIWR